jgi:hypothetical protein
MNVLLVKGYDSNCKTFHLTKKNLTINNVSSLGTTKLELLSNFFLWCTCTKLITINK